MTGPSIVVKLDGHHRIYRPGEILSGLYSWQVDAPAAAARIELSVLWHTEGKGDEDFAVHFFDAFEPADAGSEAHRSSRFATQLPNCPLSYDGAIVKVRWCVRVRLFLRDRQELLAEKEFQLGNVPSVHSRERALARLTRAAEEDGSEQRDEAGESQATPNTKPAERTPANDTNGTGAAVERHREKAEE